MRDYVWGIGSLLLFLLALVVWGFGTARDEEVIIVMLAAIWTQRNENRVVLSTANEHSEAVNVQKERG